MSLFPAYSTVDNIQTDTNVSASLSEQSWLTNPSFIKPSAIILTNDEQQNSTTNLLLEKIEPNAASTNANSANSNAVSSKKASKHKHLKKKHHKHHKKKKGKTKFSVKSIEFTGKEEYYVDKRPERSYITKDTLEKTVCPRYRVRCRQLGTLTPYQIYLLHRKTMQKYKRYYRLKGKRLRNTDEVPPRSTEKEFLSKTKKFNKRLGENPSDIRLWLEYVKLQDNFYLKTTKMQRAERKMDILNKAIMENLGNEELYREYIRIIKRNFPTFEVSKILDGLLEKDPISYVLWNAQILSTQGSLARCIVPDVLKIYERCMKHMYKKNQYDEVTLKLFTSCALFLRQSGLYEQFWALIVLALEMNGPDHRFSKIQPSENDQNMLIEYEETVLKSGLPMNEIWLRCEKLRQCFYFLPCPSDRTCSDPQRIVYNNDVSDYIYPLKNKEYFFNLVIIILRLLKIPLPGPHGIKLGFLSTSSVVNSENQADFDCIEEILPVFLYKTIFKGTNSLEGILCDLVKDFSNGPSYISTHIGHELYLKCVTDFLWTCAECFPLAPSKRIIFILLWLKLERIILIIDKILNKWNEEKEKRLRMKIKNLLKRNENRNCLVFYVEYALIEYELKRFNVMEGIFIAAISQANPNDEKLARAEFWAAHVTYAEMLLHENQLDKAMNVLSCLVFETKISDTGNLTTPLTDAHNFSALKKLAERLKDLMFIERNIESMELEDGLLPDYFINVTKAKIYYSLLWKEANDDPVKQIEILIKTFPDQSARHRFLRESFFEIYVNILFFLVKDSRDKPIKITEKIIYDVLSRALNEFPNNLLFLKLAATLDAQTWHRIRTLLSKQHSPISIVFLIAAAQHRYKKYTILSQKQLTDEKANHLKLMSVDMHEVENTYKMRVCNLLKSVTSKIAPTRKNSLLWRIYMKSLLDLGGDFAKSKKILYAALDECPWNKALYMDGTVYVPQELPHLQDLIIEKQLRIYALPEELEILRNYTV